MKGIFSKIIFIVGVISLAVGIFFLIGSVGWALVSAGIALIVIPFLQTLKYLIVKSIDEQTAFEFIRHRRFH